MAGNTWLGVIRHLTFTGFFPGVNGLGTWGVEDNGHWKIDLPFVNSRQHVYGYTRDKDGNPTVTSGGSAWEFTLPGTLVGLSDKVEGKVIIQEGHPDVTYLASLGHEFFSFKGLIEKLGVKLFLNDRVYKALGPFRHKLLPFFDRLAANAPNFKISGAIGFGLGVTKESFEAGTFKPYLRLLTLAELKLQTNLAGAAGPLGKAAARYLGAHELDATFKRGGGRSWQISSLANIPSM